MFPEDENLSNSKKTELLIGFFKNEIDEGTWDNKTKEKFSDVLDYLLRLDSSDESSFSSK